MRVKVCGLRTPADVAAARDADAVGFVVLSPSSPRDLPPTEAAELAALAAPFQTPVFVTSETQGDELAALVAVHRPAALQLPASAGSIVLSALKGRFPRTRLLAALRPEDWPKRPAQADAYVLDALEGTSGGTGRRLDADRVAPLVAASDRPVILAGGLGPENVADAVARARPWGVDASSGLESAPGVKDPERIRRFVRAAREAAVKEGL